MIPFPPLAENVRETQRQQRIAADIAHHESRPFDLILRLEGSTADWCFGRFRTADRAFEIADQCMRARRREDLPFGRVCRGYRVIDWRTGETVERSIEATELERAA